MPLAILRDVDRVGGGPTSAGGWRPPRRAPGVSAWLLDRTPVGRRVVLALARRRLRTTTHGNYPAPFAALEAVEQGLRHGVAAGLKREAELFGPLAVGDVSRKLVQIFFATTALKKDFGIPSPPEPREVRRLGVVGAGFMGAGIAGTAVVQAQVDVRLKDADLRRVARGLAAARGIVDERLARGRITRYEHTRLVALLSGDDHYTGFGRAELVIEAVFEELGLKQQVVSEIEAATPASTIVATNTSSIPIASIAGGARRPDRASHRRHALLLSRRAHAAA